MKKVCIVCPYSYPIPAIKGGAIEQIVDGLCRVNEVEKQLQITVLTLEDSDVVERYGEFKYTKFIPFKGSKLDDMWFFVFRCIKKVFKVYIPQYPRFIKIKKWIEENKNNYDVFLFEDGLTYAIPFLFKNVDKNKVISHLHWIGDPNKKTNSYISKLFAVSNYVAELWANKTDASGIEIKVLKNGINLANFQKKLTASEKEDLRKSLGIALDEKVIIYVGRIVPEKGVKELVMAMEKLKRYDVVLLMLGGAKFAKKTSTAYEQEIDSLISNAKHKIIRTGYVNNQEVYKYQNIADVAVMPTTCEEAAPLSTVESMTAGLPLIITNSGGMPEYVNKESSIVVNKEIGLVDNLALAIEELVENDTKRNRMSNVARDGAVQYSIENTYKELCSYLNEC